jgi:hypothetical protein
MVDSFVFQIDWTTVAMVIGLLGSPLVAALRGHHAMSELSPLSGAKRK